MLSLEQQIKLFLTEAIQRLYGIVTDVDSHAVKKTKKDFRGDFTVNVFPYLRYSKKTVEETATEIYDFFKPTNAGLHLEIVSGFINIEYTNAFWLQIFEKVAGTENYGPSAFSLTNQTVLVEYSSPNTNKPLHLGHIRNNLLGYSLAKILKAAGNKVIKTNLVNDRGIHICKSMLAWQKWGNSETPESSGLKGDHLVGKYYVMFDKHYQLEIKAFIKQGKTKEEAEKIAPLMVEIKDLLLKWEAGDKATRALWEMMNAWVYKGFDETYNRLGVDFDNIYYESNTYLLGKDIIDDGLAKGVFKRREDNSVYIDLTSDGLDEKTLLRSDGTSVYMTQDLGTALQRQKETHFEKLIYG